MIEQKSGHGHRKDVFGVWLNIEAYRYAGGAAEAGSLRDLSGAAEENTR